MNPPSHPIEILAERIPVNTALFHRSQDCCSFVLSHAVLRIVLSWYTDTEPTGLKYARSRLGNPALLGEATCRDIRFNLSHSGRRAVIAVTRGLDVGVGIERVDPGRADMVIAGRFFSPHEITTFRNLPKSDRTIHDLNPWPVS